MRIQERETETEVRLLVFGEPSSGKSTLMTCLWELADKDHFSANLNRSFQKKAEGLQRGEPLQSDPPGEDMPEDLAFVLDTPSGASGTTCLCTHDYAGESALQFLQTDAGIVRELLVRTDAVLLLVDAFRYCTGGDAFAAWAEQVGLARLLEWMRDHLSDKHRGGLPFCIACSRADLVDEAALAHLMAEVRAYVEPFGLHPEVVSLSAFGAHRAEGCPETPEALSNAYLVPAGALNTGAVRDLVLALVREHEARRRPRAWRPLGMLLGGLVLLLLLGTCLGPRVPVEPRGPSGRVLLERFRELDGLRQESLVRERFADVPGLGEQADPVRHLYGFLQERAMADDVRADLQARWIHLLDLDVRYALNSLVYDPAAGAWESNLKPAYFAFAEDLLVQAGETSVLLELRQARRRALARIPVSSLPLEELERLVREYRRLDMSVPVPLTRQLSHTVLEAVTAELERGLNDAVREGDFERVYHQRLPARLRAFLSRYQGVVAQEVVDLLQEALDYLAVLESMAVRETTRTDPVGVRRLEFRFRFRGYEGGPRGERLFAFRYWTYTGTDPRAAAGVRRGLNWRHGPVIPENRMLELDAKNDLLLSWRYGDQLALELTSVTGGRLLYWNTHGLDWNAPNSPPELLPGLTFLVFRQLEDGVRPPGLHQEGAGRVLFTEGAGDLHEVMNPPELLVRANRLRLFERQRSRP